MRARIVRLLAGSTMLAVLLFGTVSVIAPSAAQAESCLDSGCVYSSYGHFSASFSHIYVDYGFHQHLGAGDVSSVYSNLYYYNGSTWVVVNQHGDGFSNVEPAAYHDQHDQLYLDCAHSRFFVSYAIYYQGVFVESGTKVLCY